MSVIALYIFRGGGERDRDLYRPGSFVAALHCGQLSLIAVHMQRLRGDKYGNAIAWSSLLLLLARPRA